MAKKEIVITVDGEPFDMNPVPPLAKKTKEFLDGLPVGELVSIQQLGRTLKCNPDSVANYQGVLTDYKFSHRNRVYYGHPNTIKALRNGRDDKE
jgi:hypothetical protein